MTTSTRAATQGASKPRRIESLVFWVSAGLVLLLVAAWVLWMLFDAWAPMIFAANMKGRLDALPSFLVPASLREFWDTPEGMLINFVMELPPTARRYAALAVAQVAFFVGLVALAACAFRMRRSRGHSSRRATVLAALAFTAGSYVAYDELVWWGLRMRVSRDLPRFQETAAKLDADWPTGLVQRHPLGRVFGDRKDGRPRVFLLESPLPSSRQPIGHEIERLEDGGLRIGLGPAGAVIEWHPDGCRPGRWELPYRSMDPARTADLGEGWYLVDYR